LADIKPDVLVAGSLLYPATLDELDREFTTHKLWLAGDKAALIASCADRVRAIATTGFPVDGADAALIDAFPRLEIIASFGVGVDPIDLGAARRRNIIVTNTPAVMNDCAADLAIGLMIAAARRLCEGDRYVRAGKWLQAPLPPARKVSGKRLGILGLAVEVEKEVINIMVATDQVDRVFERIYLAGNLDTPGMGLIYVTPLEKAATHIPREIAERLGRHAARPKKP